MRIWKRNAVVSVIVLFVCVALYLSWSYGREPAEEDTTVFDPASSLTDVSPSPSGGAADGLLPDGDMDISSASDNGYFAEARLTRQKARDNALSILNEAADRENTSQEVRDNAASEIEKLAQYALTEATIENLIIAKGYSECVAFINQDGISIVVSSPIGGLNAEDAAKITDIVLTNSTMTALDIKIVPVET